MSKVKSLPLDVQLLRIGLEYARKRIKNEDVASLFQNPDNGIISAQNYQNMHYFHAKVNENPPEIELKCGKAFQETLYCDVSLGNIIINKVELEVEHLVDDVDKDVEAVKRISGLSNFDMLDIVVPYAIADALCDLEYHPKFHAEDIEAFGQKGAKNVEAFKQKWLGPSQEHGLTAYRLGSPFRTCLEESKVTFDFECVVKGNEGFGTEFVYVTGDRKISKIIGKRN